MIFSLSSSTVTELALFIDGAIINSNKGDFPPAGFLSPFKHVL